MSESAKRGGRSGKRARARNADDFLVVGVGASAGGIRAIEHFLDKMSAESGMAFVVVLHLSPEHESSLASMFQRHTRMPVQQVTDRVAVKPNHVYVVPPAKNLLMEDGHIRLVEPERGSGRHAPIDIFFRTLGAAYREHAIGIVLSGTGTDGTLGLRRIKEEGGISIAQEPQEAEYDGMPRSAIHDGMVDFVLPIGEMPEKLVGIRLASEQIQLPPEGDQPPKSEELQALREILSMLRTRTGHDFSNYKQSTILRRVTRRMQMHQVSDLVGYQHYLREHQAELPDLQQDLLISVTNFFRDRTAFEFLEKKVVSKLFEGKGAGDQVRVWVTGCATGEEAYSLAILLTEYAETLGDHAPRVQVFATDLDTEAITHAREGLFPETIATDVSLERLNRFFTHEGQHYQIRKQVRDAVLFAPHNILRDPPFSRLDMVSCRNLLIYLNRETQNRVLEIFHFSLRPGGFLFLGSSESADALSDLFSPVEKKLRVYRRTGVESVLQMLPSMPLPPNWETRLPVVITDASRTSYSYAQLHRMLLEHYAPPSILVNEGYDVVHVSENAGKYLRVSGGEFSRNLLHLIHADLRLELRAILYSAQQEQHEQATRQMSVRLDGDEQRVRLIARPIRRPDLHANFLLVIFDEQTESPASSLPAGETQQVETASLEERANLVRQIEDELQQTRNVLHTTVEQYETTTEELRASNEELQAINEELRSATEELETGKEELQSVNEELQTVNHELKDKVQEAGRVNADLSNLLAGTDIATVFLDRELRIMRYTPRLTDIFNIIPSDVGRPLMHLTHKLDYQELVRDAERVVHNLEKIEREVGANGRWYAVRLLPYRTMEDKINGVVVTFIDVSERKRASDEAQEKHRLLMLAAEATQAGWGRWDLQTRATDWDERGKRIMGFETDDEARTYEGWLGRIHAEDRPAVEAQMQDSVANHQDFRMDYRVVHAGDRMRYVRASGSFTYAANGTPLFGTGLVFDVTEATATAEASARFESIVELSEDAVISFHLDRRIATWNQGATRLFGYAAQEAIGQHISLIVPPKRADEIKQAFAHFEKGEAISDLRTVRRTKDGDLIDVSISASPVINGEGRLIGGAIIARDFTKQHAMEMSLRTSEERLHLILESIKDYAIFTIDLQGCITRWNKGAYLIFGLTAEEAIGQNTSIIFTPEDRERGAHIQEMETALREGRAEDERWHLRKDGSGFYASGVLTPLRNGDVEGFVKVARDLTEWKQMEQMHTELSLSLEQERALLEQRVEDRTRLLMSEVAERRAAEGRNKGLISRIVEAQELERRRISRDLHDILGQQLTALRLNLEAIKGGCSEHDAAMSSQIEQAQAVAERLDAEVDFMAWELRPAALDELGLAATLENYAHEWSEHFHVPAEYHSSGLSKRRLTPEIETNLYRIAQEALNNIAKHAEAKRVGIILERRGKHVALIIEDDGRGFETEGLEANEARGMGLLNMRERASLVGGTLEIESAPGEGTTIFARVPATFVEKRDK